jgi:Mg-chelatase subunit ChlD
LRSNSTKAFQDYFAGVNHYKEGNLKLADQYFQNANNIIPTNFSFCLSYALTQGRLNHVKKAEALMSQANRLLKGTEEEIIEKKALVSFFRGMIQIYNLHFDEAQISLNNARQLFGKIGEKRVVSVIYNAIGFSIFAHQGTNFDKSNDKALHKHLYPVSLFRAANYFQKSLYADPSNLYAQHNFSSLSDTLCLDYSAPVLKKPILDPYQISEDWLSSLLKKLQIHPEDEIVFLIDISGSMVTEKVSCTGLDRFRTAQWLTNSILKNLVADHQIGIATIGGDCQNPPTVWKKVGSISSNEIQATLSNILPEGSTPLAKMIALSPGLFSTDGKKKKSLILISDGANTCPYPQQQICTSAEILAQMKIKVHVLSFLQNTTSHAAAFADYECLTETTAGKLLYLEDNQCQMNTISYDLIQACGLKLPAFEKSNCLGPSVPNLWMYYPSDLFTNHTKNLKQ